jgi:type VI protein secretion system component VasK
MPDDQGVQPSSAQIDDYRGAQQLQKVKRRLRRRVVRLRILAYVFLTLVILVLAGGTAAFAFANYIARLTLSPPQTAASQYAKLMDDKRRQSEQLDALDRKQQEILNQAVIIDPYNEKLATAQSRIHALRRRYST